MRVPYRVSVLLVLMVCAASAQAATGKEAVQACVDLSAAHKVLGYGSQLVLVADGDAHYRLKVDNSCDALATATRFQLSSAGQAGRICPEGTSVKTNDDNCDVTSVERIDARTYSRYLRSRR